MKQSFYNLFFPFNGQVILYNALGGAIFIIDQEMKAALERNDFSSLDEEYRTLFMENGILIDNDEDEQDMVHSLYEESKYDTVTTTFHVIPTYDCNLSCTYCDQGKGGDITTYMDTEAVQRCSRFITDLTEENYSKALAVELFGGEPLLHMPVNCLLAESLRTWCEEHNKLFFLIAITNGTLFTSDVLDTVSPYDCSFIVPVDGPRTIHDQRRQYKTGGRTFDHIMEGVQKVVDYGLEVKMRINVDATNVDSMVELFETLKSAGFQSVKLSFKQSFNTSPACMASTYCIPDGEGLKAVNNLRAMARSMKFSVEESEEPSLPGACPAQKIAYFTIDPYLNLYKCAILPPDTQNAVGHIDAEGIPHYNALYSDFFSRDLSSLESCQTCTLLPACRGGCPAEIYCQSGTTHGTVCRKSEIAQTVQETVIQYVKTEVLDAD
jgi:uncharacterized protein